MDTVRAAAERGWPGDVNALVETADRFQEALRAAIWATCDQEAMYRLGMVLAEYAQDAGLGRWGPELLVDYRHQHHMEGLAYVVRQLTCRIIEIAAMTGQVHALARLALAALAELCALEFSGGRRRTRLETRT
ncbi:hypothetical protein [Rhizohabitans arisaemae]|uniref:hypothetical protein n=1 Tax=Rhizohabitans arisaemae TaxID=2720610 RepID=UPI0024B276DA|nr:hypothetical protein [Rhizohabitans arisaemae]